MKIKLHARLNAYSKISNIEATLPAVTDADAGSVLGVDKSGNYTLFAATSPADIDTLFKSKSHSVTASARTAIDNLFKE